MISPNCQYKFRSIRASFSIYDLKIWFTLRSVSVIHVNYSGRHMSKTMNRQMSKTMLLH